MTTTSSQIQGLLRPGVKTVFGQYHTFPLQYKEIYETYLSERNYEQDIETKFLGAANIINEGEPISSDSMGQRYTTTYKHVRVGLNTTFTKISWDDNLYKNQFPQQMKSLRMSMVTTKDTLGAAVFNNAFNPLYPIGDGQPLCSQTHPIDGGTISNAFGAGGATVDLSEAALEQAIIQIQQFKSLSGILSNVMQKKLLIPPQLQFTATRILKSTNRIDTSNNDINAIYNGSFIPQGYKVNNYLTSGSSWFLLTNADNAFKCYQRENIKTDSWVDYPTDNVMFKISERYSFGCSNFRGVFGSPGV